MSQTKNDSWRSPLVFLLVALAFYFHETLERAEARPLSPAAQSDFSGESDPPNPAPIEVRQRLKHEKIQAKSHGDMRGQF